MTDSRLLAVSDLHVRYPENRAVVEGLRPGSDGDWLIGHGPAAHRSSGLTPAPCWRPHW